MKNIDFISPDNNIYIFNLIRITSTNEIEDKQIIL